MNDRTEPLNPERFRAYLRLLARTHLPRRLAPKIDSSDIVQQTLIQAHGALAGFRGGTQREMAAWLRAILTHQLAHAVRDCEREKRDVRREVRLAERVEESSARLEAWLAAEQSSPSLRAERREQLVLLADALESLPDEQREAVELHYVQAWTLQRIAEHLGRTPPSTAGLVRRGVTRLREVFASL